MNEKIKGNFSFDSIDDFDEHIRSSIPRYEDIHHCLDGLIQYFIGDKCTIYDLGCSTGVLLLRIRKNYPDKRLRLVGVDISKNLLPKDFKRRQDIEFVLTDITSNDFEIERADIVFSIFTLCFVPYRSRLDVVRKVYEGLTPGGAFIFTDKVYSSDARVQDIFTFLYYDFKRQTYSEQEILDKEISLREIQKPLTWDSNIALVKRAGFNRVESFWRFWNFGGWICIK